MPRASNQGPPQLLLHGRLIFFATCGPQTTGPGLNGLQGRGLTPADWARPPKNLDRAALHPVVGHLPCTFYHRAKAQAIQRGAGATKVQAHTAVTFCLSVTFGDLSTLCRWQPPCSPTSVYTSPLHKPARTSTCPTLKTPEQARALRPFLLNPSHCKWENGGPQRGCLVH